MANRDVFYVDSNNNYQKKNVEFKWFPGFAKVQKQKSIASLHTNFMKQFNQANIIEISSASTNPVGIHASAFNLKLKTKEGTFRIEQIFQSAKVYSKSGPQESSLKLSPKDAKRKSYRLNKTEKLVAFEIFGHTFSLEPQTLFYDWIYLNALFQHKTLMNELIKYDAFTDINVKPNYTINSQAKSCSIFVSLCRKYSLDEFHNLIKIENIDQFSKVVYGK